MLRDIDIRSALKVEKHNEHARDPGTVIVDELGLRQGSVRVDVAVVNGVLHGFEIKSDADSLARLDQQVKTYSEVLDLSTIVVAGCHVEEAAHRLPAWWGLVHAERRSVDGALNQTTFTTLRPPTPNPSVNSRALAELLWHDEALALLTARGAGRGLSRKPRKHAWDRLCDVYSLDEIRSEVRSQLKKRAVLRSARPSL
jgi:hypothetical protein